MGFIAAKFRHYLRGRLFHFYVDCQALLYLINKVAIQGRLMRWMFLLQEFDFKIEEIIMVQISYPRALVARWKSL